MYAIWYDGIRRFFMRAKHEGSPVETVFARPDRAHTEIGRRVKDRLRREAARTGTTPPPGLAATVQGVEDRPTPVPFMSVWVQPPQFDPARFSPATFRGVTKDPATGNATSMRFPRPMTAAVQVDLWCGDDGGELIAHHIESQLEQFFVAESVYVPVDFGLTKWYKAPFNVPEHMRVYGRTRFRLVTDRGWADTSDLEEGGDGPKDTRRTWTGRMEAYAPYRPEEARLVLAVRLELYDGTDETAPTLLAESVTDAED